jgi:hypothetical protein
MNQGVARYGTSTKMSPSFRTQMLGISNSTTGAAPIG